MKLPHRRRSSHGYTLLELVTTLPLTALLMLGLASSIQISARAIPDGRGMPSATFNARTALDLLDAELRCATSITSRSATEIVFITPDRSGDGSAESMRYRWPGTAGSALTRQFNGSTAETLIASVQDFSLSYDSKLDGGTLLLRAVNVRVIAPAGTTARLDARIPTVNEPVLP